MNWEKEANEMKERKTDMKRTRKEEEKSECVCERERKRE